MSAVTELERNNKKNRYFFGLEIRIYELFLLTFKTLSF